MSREWTFLARPSQLLPDPDQVGRYHTLAWITGRGFGKTRSAAEAFHERVRWLGNLPRQMRRNAGFGAVIHRTSSDIQKTCIHGPDGLMATAPKGWLPVHNGQKGTIEWPNGFIAYTFSAESPDQLRGPSLSLSWAEEFAAWRGIGNDSGATAWDNLKFAMRGDFPLTLVTTTPKRTKAVKDLERRAAVPGSGVVIIRGSLRENLRNVPVEYVNDLVDKYGNSPLGLQEIDGLIAMDADGAAMKSVWLEEHRVDSLDDCPEFGLVVIGVDPSVGDGSGDECGIVVVALSASKQHDGKIHAYVDDASIAGTPDQWAAEIARVCEFWGTYRVVVESNQGNELLKAQFRQTDRNIRLQLVHAATSKLERARGAAMLAQRGEFHMIGEQPDLETQLCTWTPVDKYSPDRMDALKTWRCTEIRATGTRRYIGSAVHRGFSGAAHRARGQR